MLTLPCRYVPDADNLLPFKHHKSIGVSIMTAMAWYFLFYVHFVTFYRPVFYFDTIETLPRGLSPGVFSSRFRDFVD